ncbi:MAG: hypothetical protein C4586_06720 [Anaerolineaceae bacterium]|nr:MAG: hypothetical protein C4586_06720 [Anaerolineaceae bacterium]
MAESKPIYEKVEHSPYQPKDKVVILGFSDETGDQEFIGEIGIVEYLEYSCGCGQSYPNDPMIGIKFFDGSLIECWSEEISGV